jgi:N-acetyl-anhydromuramyl-L-alanine amidase AmpD
MYYLLDRRNPVQHFYTTRRKPIQIIVVHTTEQLPDLIGQDSGAENVAQYASTTTRKVSWHQTVDSDSIIPTLPDSYTAWHVRGYNSLSLGVEISTQAKAWPTAPPRWTEATITNLSDVIRRWGELYQIPYQRITRTQVDDGTRGIVAHSDLDPTRRTDPGVGFPWTMLWRRLGVKDDETMRPGDRGTDTRKLQNYLNRWAKKSRINATGLIADGIYGPATETRVREFQQWATLDPTGEANPITVATLAALVLT